MGQHAVRSLGWGVYVVERTGEPEDGTPEIGEMLDAAERTGLRAVAAEMIGERAFVAADEGRRPCAQELEQAAEERGGLDACTHPVLAARRGLFQG